MALTPEQIQIIKATVPVVQEHGKTITSTFYSNLLKDVPDLNNIFNTPNQINGSQPAALAYGLYAYAANIDNLAVLGEFVERVCHRHASLFVQREHYDIVGTYLLAAMKQILGDAFTPEIKDAWTVAYNQLADIMAGREEQLYQEADGWTDWREFKIAKKVPESSEITSFYLVPVDGKSLPSYRPGQYISVRTEVPELKYKQPRQYSLSDRPGQDYYRISVKREEGAKPLDANGKVYPGYVSNILHANKEEGDILEVSHPFGDFFLPESSSSNPLVLLSAGVGLTPMVSIVNTLFSTAPSLPSSSTSSGAATPISPSSTLSTASARKISFVHGARSSDTHAFKSHIQALASANPDQLHVVFFNKAPADSAVHGQDYHHTSRVELGKLDDSQDLYLDDSTTEYYICGPESFMSSMRDDLLAKGVEQKRIKLELFGTGQQ